MSWRGIGIIAICWVVLNGYLETSYVKAAEGPQTPAAESAESPRPTIEQLVAACASAKTAFAPPTEADLKQARAELLASVARLDARLRAPGGEGWRAFLRWKDMQEQLARGKTPDLAVLDAVYARYASGNNGLELVWFADVRQALRRYLTTARAIGDPKLKAQYEALLDVLPKHLQEYHGNPTTEGATVIGEAIRWLEEAGQAAELIQAVRRHFSHPNLFLELSADLIGAGIAGPVDDTGPVVDVILGTNIRGTQHTTGELTVELIPRDTFAEISTVFRGTIHSDTVGSNGPARITSEGVTRVASRKSLRVDAEHVWTLPTKSRAITSTTIKSVRTVRGGPGIQQTARDRAYSQKSQAEQIAARHAEQRINERLDEEADKQTAKLAKDFQEKFRKPLLERKLFPEQLRFHSTTAAVHATALHGGVAGLGASGPPPALEGDYDLIVRLHESAVNNLMAAAWAGMIVEEEAFRARITELLESTPAWLEPDEEAQPWTITFARREPISVTFADGGFTVTISGRTYTRGENSYPGMNVKAAYKIQRAGEGFTAVRQGGLEILPPGFASEQGKQLSARQQVLRSLLEKRFGKIFQEQLVPEPFALPGEWEKAGKLALAKWEASGGWLVLAWKLAATGGQGPPDGGAVPAAP